MSYVYYEEPAAMILALARRWRERTIEDGNLSQPSSRTRASDEQTAHVFVACVNVNANSGWFSVRYCRQIEREMTKFPQMSLTVGNRPGVRSTTALRSVAASDWIHVVKQRLRLSLESYVPQIGGFNRLFVIVDFSLGREQSYVDR